MFVINKKEYWYIVDKNDGGLEVWLATQLIKKWDDIPKGAIVYSTTMDGQGEFFPRDTIYSKDQIIVDEDDKLEKELNKLYIPELQTIKVVRRYDEQVEIKIDNELAIVLNEKTMRLVNPNLILSKEFIGLVYNYMEEQGESNQ